MRYLLYLPNPKTLTYEDCHTMDALMKRIQASGLAKVEEAVAIFHMEEMLVQYKKYRVMLGESAKTKQVEEMVNVVENACISEKEKAALKQFHCMHGKTGYWEEIKGYLKENKKKERFDSSVKEAEKPVLQSMAA